MRAFCTRLGSPNFVEAAGEKGRDSVYARLSARERVSARDRVPALGRAFACDKASARDRVSARDVRGRASARDSGFSF